MNLTEFGKFVLFGHIGYIMYNQINQTDEHVYSPIPTQIQVVPRQVQISTK